ncbi:hypothetical protein LNP74_24860 [Klebsiella pneumoniae subsp. pneumoniae]|nr:hypothetical protein [Klebsiella pneumoniae subsp. pneumoniae]
MKCRGRTAPCSAIWRRRLPPGGQRAHSLAAKAEQLPGQAFERGYLPRRIPTSCASCASRWRRRDGAIVSVQGFARGETNLLLERLYIERSLSVNTAAAGGNASPDDHRLKRGLPGGAALTGGYLPPPGSSLDKVRCAAIRAISHRAAIS